MRREDVGPTWLAEHGPRSDRFPPSPLVLRAPRGLPALPVDFRFTFAYGALHAPL